MHVLTAANPFSFFKDIEMSFKSYVKKFVEETFNPTITVKQINGTEITTYELFEYFKVIFTAWNAHLR